MDDIKAKLKTEIEQADWDMLTLHNDNKAVFIVSGHLSLEDVGYALASDKSDFVKVWLDNGELCRPTPAQVDEWSKDKFKKMCHFIIVQPYVLIKLID